MRIAAAAIALTIAACAATSASAAPWKRVTTPDGSAGGRLVATATASFIVELPSSSGSQS